MATVETVRGPIDVAQLGRTLMHEHVFIMDPEAFQNYGGFWGEPYWDEEVRVADAVAKLRALKEAGIDSIVDPTAVGLGRFVPRVQRVNEQADINIVVATGLYAFLEVPNFFKYRTVEAITEFFVREIREGIDGTGVKAAFLKCAVEEHGLIGDVPKIVQAIAAASLGTGAPIMVHTNAAAQSGTVALDAFVRHGVDPRKVVIAHAGDSNDVDYLRRIADQGAILGCDRFGIDFFNPMPDRIRTLAALAAEGYADRIILSHDAAAFMDFFTGDPNLNEDELDYLLISREVLPALVDAGVTPAQIQTMLVETPRRFFGGDA